MSKRIVFRPRATSDLREQAAFIAKDSLEAAERFTRAADETFEQLAAMPEMGVPRAHRNESHSGLRMFPVRSFGKHLVFYRPCESRIEIVRVLHAARDLAALLEGEE